MRKFTFMKLFSFILLGVNLPTILFANVNTCNGYFNELKVYNGSVRFGVTGWIHPAVRAAFSEAKKQIRLYHKGIPQNRDYNECVNECKQKIEEFIGEETSGKQDIECARIWNSDIFEEKYKEQMLGIQECFTQHHPTRRMKLEK